MDNNDTITKTIPVPNIGGAFSHGWQQLWKHFLYLFLIAVIIGILSFPMGLGDAMNGISERSWDGPSAGFVMLQVLAFMYWLLLFPVFDYGADLLYLRAVRDEPIDIKEMFQGFNRYLDIVLANLLVGAIITLGIIFFLIPGIIFACRLAFVSYLVMDRNMDPVKAVEKSWYMTRGHGWTIFGMGVLTFFLFIFGLVLLIVGVFPALMWSSTSFASLYYAVDSREKAELKNGDN